MKKLLFLLMCAAAFLYSCSSDAALTNNEPGGASDLQSFIDKAESGGTIDLSTVGGIAGNRTYTVGKELIIKNGNLNNASLFIDASGVKLEDVEGISSITVSEKVGDGDFTMEGCGTVGEVVVSGGGSNSIKIGKTVVSELVVQKAGVRILLTDSSAEHSGAKVEKAFILENCKLESAAAGNSFKSVIVSEAVERLSLAGQTVIEKIVSAAVGAGSGASISIVVDASVKITAADATIVENIEENPDKKGFEVGTIKENIEADESDIKDAAARAFNMFGVGSDPDTLTMKYISTKDKQQYSNVEALVCGGVPGLTIEKSNDKADGYPVIAANAEAKGIESIWSVWLEPFSTIQTEAGKNYKISVDLKADTPGTVVYIGTCSEHSPDTSGRHRTVGTEFETYSVETGTMLAAWTAGKLRIAMATAKKLYIKNLKVEEIEEKSLRSSIFIGAGGSLSDVDIDASLDGGTAAKITFTSGTNGSGANLFVPDACLVGALYKVTADISSDVELLEGELEVWTHGLNDVAETAGFGSLSCEKDVVWSVAMYMPMYKDAGMDETTRVPHIWLSVTKPCTLTVRNIKAEKTTLDEIFAENPQLSLYYAGNRISCYGTPDAVWKEWVLQPIEKLLEIQPGESMIGQVILCDSKGWESIENPATSFRMMNDASAAEFNTAFERKRWGAVINENAVDCDFKLESDGKTPLSVTFSLDEEYKVVVHKN